MNAQPSLFDVCESRHKGNARSVAANERVEPTKSTTRKEVYAEIVKAGAYGTTLKEVAAKRGVQVNTISGRFTELEDKRNKRYDPAMYIVIKSGPPRDGCSVYIADIYSFGEARAGTMNAQENTVKESVLQGERLKAPFPWFGGKSRVSDLVWDRFGNVPNYCEPFFGSGAVLLGRPHSPHTETINDLDCFVANFWRAVQKNPDGVAEHADNPVNEADQHARHLWLCSQEDFRERMKTEPDFYDERIAGWWVWGQCIWIGAGWCSVQLPHLGNAGTGVHRKLPHLGNAGKGINRQRPHLGNAGTGVHRKLPHLGNAGTGVECVSDLTSGTPSREFLTSYMRELAERLRSVRVCCGDWSRICGPSPTVKLGITGVFLDPPYADESERTDDLYSMDDGQVAHAVREWAIEWGNDSRMRIALCGYDGEHSMPSSWECVHWKARGGYGSQGDENGIGRNNSGRERIWFSPHCLRNALFAEVTG